MKLRLVVVFCLAAVALSAQTVASDRQAVLTKYCFTCHNDKVKAGNLILSALDSANPSKNAEQWEKVVRKLRMGAMPPAKMPRPDKTATDSFVASLEADLDRRERAVAGAGSRVEQLRQRN